MKTVKGVLMLVLICVFVTPCMGSDVMIKRKKNKWISSTELSNVAQNTYQSETISGW